MQCFERSFTFTILAPNIGVKGRLVDSVSDTSIASFDPTRGKGNEQFSSAERRVFEGHYFTLFQTRCMVWNGGEGSTIALETHHFATKRHGESLILR